MRGRLGGSCCETAAVSFHENFWLAVNAAAPVIMPHPEPLPAQVL
jgi:hypothetical protein